MPMSSPLVTAAHPPPGRTSPAVPTAGGRPSVRPNHHHPIPAATPRLGERGQATAEYALVLLGAAAIALLLAAWAAQSGQVGRLFDVVVDQLIDRAG